MESTGISYSNFWYMYFLFFKIVAVIADSLINCLIRIITVDILIYVIINLQVAVLASNPACILLPQSTRWYSTRMEMCNGRASD